MKHIENFILERLTLNKYSKMQKLIEIEGMDECKKKQFEKDELHDISHYASLMPIPPQKIEMGKNGNVKLFFKKTNDFLIVNISKPARYHGCWKITMDVGNWAPFEYPIGNGYAYKNGDLKLPNAEATINKLQEQIDKRNLLK